MKAWVYNYKNRFFQQFVESTYIDSVNRFYLPIFIGLRKPHCISNYDMTQSLSHSNNLSHFVDIMSIIIFGIS